jgi:hypothetical protein
MHRETVRIISNVKQLRYFVNQATFKNLVIVFMKKPVVQLNKPIYTAFTVLDLSKLFMYEWHYDKIKMWYGNRFSIVLYSNG